MYCIIDVPDIKKWKLVSIYMLSFYPDWTVIYLF